MTKPVNNLKISTALLLVCALLFSAPVKPSVALSGIGCLSPWLNKPLPALSENEYTRLKTNFEQSRDPKDLLLFLKKIDPLLQRAMRTGLTRDFAVEQERRIKEEISILTPTTNNPNDKEVIIRDDDLMEAEEEFRRLNGHFDFRVRKDLVDLGNIESYQVGTLRQTYYPFCCIFASATMENILRNIEGLKIFHLTFFSSDDEYKTKKHHASLVIDIYTGHSYYISLVDGQFLKPVNKDGSQIKYQVFGYFPTKHKNAYLGDQRRGIYTNPEYIEWYQDKGLDRLCFFKTPAPLNPNKPETPALLDILQSKGFIPENIDRLESQQTFFPAHLETRIEFGEYMDVVTAIPVWLANDIDPDIKYYYQQLSSAA